MDGLALLLVVCGVISDVPVPEVPGPADGGSAPIVETWLHPRPLALPDPVRSPATPSPAADGLETAAFLPLDQDPEGDMPREVAFLPDGSAVVVVNRDTDTVVFFDIDTLTITDTVTVGDFPVDIAVTPDGTRVVVPNVLDDSVSIIDVATKSVMEVPITGSQPFSVAITSDSALAVVAVINDGLASSFSVVDLATGAEASTFASGPQGVFGFFFGPESGIFGNTYTQFALASDDKTLVLPDRGGDRVRLYDITTGLETADLPTLGAPTSVDISADGTLAVIGHEFGNNAISTIDLQAGSVANSFSTANDVTNQVIRITPDKSHAIAAISNNVIFVNLTSGATTATINTGTVGDIELSFDGQYAFVSNFNSRVIDIATQAQVDTLSLAPTAEAVTSPVELRAVGLNNRFREDVHVYDIAGAAGFVEGFALSGEPFELDAPRSLAVAGNTAVVIGNTSRSVAVLDLPTGSVKGYTEAGDRGLGIALTPDGKTAVACGGDDDTVSIIDTVSCTTVATLAVNTRPSAVCIAPDGQTAYVTSVAGTDRVHFIDLDGAASSVTGSLVSGQMGSAQGYAYTELSGISCSPDGAVVGVCISFDDELLLIDTSTHTELARVPTGDFPIRCAFSPDSGTAYVANAFGDSISVIDVDGASSTLIATIPGIEFPLVLLPDDTGDFVYVGNTDGNNPRLYVIDAASNLVATTVALSGSAREGHFSALDQSLYLALNSGELSRASAAGAASAVLSTVALFGGPADLGFSETLRIVVTSQPGVGDGVDLVDATGDLFANLGEALAGTHGDPLLVGAGLLTGNSPVSFTLANAVAGSVFTRVVGTSILGAPLKGGVLVPQPALLVGLLPTDDGRSVLEAVWPAGFGPGLTFYLQDWIIDPAGPSGFAASNAISLTTP